MFNDDIQGTLPDQFYQEQNSESSYCNGSVQIPWFYKDSPLDQILEMLWLLGRAEDADESVHVRAVNPATGDARSFTLTDIDQIINYNQNYGYNVYLVVNPGGTKKKEITECLSTFFEHDDRPKEQQFEIWKEHGLPEPTFQVDTGGKSIHHYYVFGEPISVEQWRNLQRRLLAVAAGSDQNLKDPSRVLTLPGSCKFAGKTYPKLGLAEQVGDFCGWSRLIGVSGTKYTAEFFDELLPPLEVCSNLPARSPKANKADAAHDQDHNRQKALAALKCLPPADFEGYGDWLEVGMALHSVDDGLLNEWVNWSKEMSNFDEPECSQKWDSFSEKEPGEGVGLGSLIQWAMPHGYTEPIREIAAPEKTGLTGLIAGVGPFQELDENGELMPSPRLNTGQVMTLLDKHLGHHLKLNDLQRVYEFGGIALPEDETQVSYADMQQQGWNIEQKPWLDGLLRVAQKHRYDPVLDYLRYLEKADDVEPVDINKIASNYLNTDSNLSDQMMKVAVLGAVERRFNPGCQFDSVVVLKGGQGIRKSTFWKVLCSPSWFCDTTPKDSKDLILNIHSCWIFELAELENVTGRKGVGELKALITTAFDMIKKPYGRNTERNDRRSIMVSSVNGDDFLRDPSGNRRFLVISLKQHADKGEFIPVDALERDRDRIWKAAVLAYRSGEKSRLSPEDQALSNQNNRGYLPEDLWEVPLDQWLSGEAGNHVWIPEKQEKGVQQEPPIYFTTRDALKGIGFASEEDQKLGRQEEMRMAALLQSKGFVKGEQRRLYGIRGYFWYKPE